MSGRAFVKVLFGTKFRPAKLNNPALMSLKTLFLSFMTIQPIRTAGIMNLLVKPEHAEIFGSSYKACILWINMKFVLT